MSEIIFMIIVSILGPLMGGLATYLLINTLVIYFREKKSDTARTLTSKEIEKISLFLLAFVLSMTWTALFAKILVELIGGN